MSAPRVYAAEILRLKTRDERRAALAAVPEEARDMVRKHVENTMWIAGNWRRRIARNPYADVPPSIRRLLDWLDGRKAS